MRKLSAAYIAGFIDGEGCIGIHKMSAHSPNGMNLSISIANTNRKVLEQIQKQYVGRISAKTGKVGWKESYTLDIYREAQERLLRDILPFLIIKRKQALLLLRAIKHLEAKDWRGSTFTPKIIAMRQRFIQRAKFLNKRGTAEYIL